MSHVEYMSEAMKLARYALDHKEVPVACVFVHEPTQSIIAYGMNDTNASLAGTKHAEFMGIDTILGLGVDFQDVTLYVTVEPCIMCASALEQVGIGKVVFGCGNDRFGGNGSIIKVNSYPSIPGVMRKEAIMLLRYFYIKENDHAPDPKQKKNRNLSQEFPPMEISMYLSKEEELEFSEFLKDSEVNWDLIDSKHDDIVDLLEEHVTKFRVVKRRKA